VLEHLHDPCAFFREAWRVLKAGHRLHLRLPYGGHRAAWWDHTHVKPWFAESFCFLQPGYAEAIGNPQHDAWDTPFGITSLSLRLGQKPARLLRWYPVRTLLVPWLEHWPTAVEEIWIEVNPLKTPEAAAAYQATHAANCVPMAYVAYEHHVRNQPVPTTGGL
jgi:SAM-dependent methyltransferase